MSKQRRQQGDARKDAIVVFIHAYRQVPPQRSPSMDKIAAGALVTIGGDRRPLLERSAVDYHVRRMRADSAHRGPGRATYQGLVSSVPGEHNSLRLTPKGTRHAERLLASDPDGFADVLAAAEQAANPTGHA